MLCDEMSEIKSGRGIERIHTKGRVMRLIAAIVLLLWATAARANDLPPIPLDQQTRAADLVIVGSVGDEASCRLNGRTEACVEIVVEDVRKGNISFPRQVVLLVRLDIGEESAGTQFLFGRSVFYLRAITDNIYEPLYGQRSIIPFFEVTRIR
jgi:hypothetical protein